MTDNNPYEKVKRFHEVFAPSKHQTPHAYSLKEAGFRSAFKAEELVEFLYATSNNDETAFKNAVEDLKNSIDQTVKKIEQKQKATEDVLVEQVDALVDLLYFTYGSFVLMGVDPTNIFNIVHQANMGKLFPDGKPHYDPVTNKVSKPDNWEKDYAPEAKIKEEIKKQLQQ